MPRLGGQYGFEVEIISKPRAEYQGEEYLKFGLPPAPAVMVGDVVVLQGPDITKEKLEAAICRQLSLPLPDSR